MEQYTELQLLLPVGTLKPTERELMIELYHTVANNWRPIGTYLCISELDIIAADHHGESQKCLMTMLNKWLHQTDPPPSWSAIAEAVEFTGRPDIAQIIRQKYCKCCYSWCRSYCMIFGIVWYENLVTSFYSAEFCQ